MVHEIVRDLYSTLRCFNDDMTLEREKICYKMTKTSIMHAVAQHCHF